MMSKAVLQKSVTVKGVSLGYHISCASSDRVWVTGSSRNLILTDTSGETLDCLTDIDSTRGVHAITKVGDLIYIDEDYNINKLSADSKAKIQLIKKAELWTARCVCVSHSTEELLVGMLEGSGGGTSKERDAMIARYNEDGQKTQTIQYTSTGLKLYTYPVYITENLNGDVIESDWNRVVVTDREGKYRFSYTGRPSEGELSPWGICTDSLLHILICDTLTYTVQMLDKDGHFLSFLLTTDHGITEFRSLSYDFKNDLLWVGSLDDNALSVFKYIENENLLQDHEANEDRKTGKATENTAGVTGNVDTTKKTETEDTTEVAGAKATTEVTETEKTTEESGIEETTEVTGTEETTELVGTEDII